MTTTPPREQLPPHFIEDHASVLTKKEAETYAEMYAREALRAQAASVEAVDMVLYCPNCGMQHIDKPEHNPTDMAGDEVWTNPPHRSHLCHDCGTIWRPADVPTNGVKALATEGNADTWPVHADEVEATPAHIPADVSPPQAPQAVGSHKSNVQLLRLIAEPLRTLADAAIGPMGGVANTQPLVDEIERAIMCAALATKGQQS